MEQLVYRTYIDLLSIRQVLLVLKQGRPYLTSQTCRIDWPLEPGMTEEDDFYLKYGVFK